VCVCVCVCGLSLFFVLVLGGSGVQRDGEKRLSSCAFGARFDYEERFADWLAISGCAEG